MELEHLDRFASVNRQAFRKILKKYRKWTESPNLEQRFNDFSLSCPSEFGNRSFVPALAHYNELLAAITAALSPKTSMQPSKLRSPSRSREHDTVKKPFSSTASNMQYVYEYGSEIEFDTMLAVSALGRPIGRACYWIHLDNLLQIQVLLLRYMRSQENRICTSVSAPSSTQDSLKFSPNRSALAQGSQLEKKAVVIICDDIEDFANRRSSSTITEPEFPSGHHAKDSAATIHLSADGDAVVAINTSVRDAYPWPDLDASLSWRTTKLRRKFLGAFFSCDAPADNDPISAENIKSQQHNGLEATEDPHELVATSLHNVSPDDAQLWFQRHEKVLPLVGICSERTRLAGIRNTKYSGLWATIDTDIVMTKCSASSLAEQYDWSSPSEDGGLSSALFPHAVLNVHFEGDDDMGLIEKLESSHLCERVRGFSLDTHAVATLCNPQSMPPPYWLPLLKQDIRKVPREGDISSQLVPSAQLTPRSWSTAPNSESAMSVGDGPTDSGLSSRLKSSDTSVPEFSEPAPKASWKQKKRIRNQSLRKKIQDHSQPPSARYWNEFDDDCMGRDNNAYTILISPQPSSAFPGATMLCRLTEPLTKKVKSIFHRQQPISHERRPLLQGHHASTLSSSDDSDLERAAATAPYRTRSPHRLRSKKGSPLPVPTTRDSYLTGVCVASFILSFVLLFMETILVNTSRKKAIPESDVGVLVGVTFSLVLGIGGLAATAAMAQKLGWLRWFVVVLLVAIIFTGNGLLLTVVF